MEGGAYMNPLEKYDCSSLSTREELFLEAMGAYFKPKTSGISRTNLHDSILKFLKKVEFYRPAKYAYF
jgi:hypothetical protein